MVDLKRMRELYKEYNYTDEQLIKIRNFLYNLAELQLKIEESQPSMVEQKRHAVS